MKILFIHPNMPGQYKHICRAFGNDPNNTVVFITKRNDINIPGVHRVTYRLARDAAATTHRYLLGVEKAVLQGQEVWRICKKLKEEEGFTPDVVVGHPGWGDMLYMKDIYPGVPVLGFFEFYYHSSGADVNFDPKDPFTDDDAARVRTKNIINLLSLESADWGVTPTRWQFSQHPKEFRYKLSVIHDGIDTEAAHPRSGVKVDLPGGVTLTEKDEIVTYVARNFEPYRGFHIFMRAAEQILKNRPNCHIIAVGADDVSYGRRPPAGTTFRQQYMKEVKLDPKRMHFVGVLPYPDLIKVFQVSSAHIYLTYPFVLSWSMMEAMASGCLLIGSNTAPIMEVLQDGVNGLVVDFFSPEQVAKRVDEVFAHKDRMQDLRRAARQTIVDRYDLKKLMPLHAGLISDLAKGQMPPATAASINHLNMQFAA